MEEIIESKSEVHTKCELCYEIIKTNEDIFKIKDKNGDKYYKLCKKCFLYKKEEEFRNRDKGLLTYFKWFKYNNLDKEYF